MKTRSQQLARGFVRAGGLRASTVVLLVVVASVVSFAAAQLRVVVTIEPYREPVARLLGDAGEVDVLLPPGASPHAFDPTPRDVPTRS